MVQEGRTATILFEQHAHQILPLTHHAVLLERGRVAWQQRGAGGTACATGPVARRDRAL